MADEQNAASSTATETQEAPSLETFTDEQRSEWLKTGKEPEPRPKKADAPAKEISAPSTDDKAALEAKPDPDPEPGQQQEPQPAPGEKRKGQLANEIQYLLKTRAELRRETERLQAEMAGKATASPAKPAASELQEPNIEDFTGENAWEDYQKATRAYNRQETQRLIQEALETDRADRAAAAQAEAVEKQNRKIETNWSTRSREFKAVHPEAKDFESEVRALADSGLIPENSFLDQWLAQSENGPALAWYFSQDHDEILRIGELHPIAASRELAGLEESLSGKKEVSVSPNNPAPKPPATVTGRSAHTVDELAEAVHRGDVRAFIDLENAREIAALRAKK